MDSFYGNLDGHKPFQILIDVKEKKPFLNQVECYKKYYTYSNDDLHLLLSEREDNGKAIFYTYVPNTNLIASKLLVNQGVICQRQFFEYDANKALRLIIKDNGHTNDKSNLKGVTERLIQELVPRQIAPVGLPETIVEKCYDPKNNKEIVLKTMTCSYTQEGKLSKQDHYDSEGQYRYSLTWEWDCHGNLIRTVNAIGQEIRKEYDANDNLVKEIGPSLDFYTEYGYDYSNRLIKITEIHPAKTFVTHHRYDYVGNKVATIDKYGQETKYVYDDFNRLIQTIYPVVGDTNGVRSQPVEVIEYNTSNLPVKVIDPKGQITRTTYNSRGQPTSIKYADGTCEAFTYNTDGSLIRYLASNGSVTIYQRDSLGRILAEDIYGHNQQLMIRKKNTYVGLRLKSTTNGEGQTTVYDYDCAGRLIKETFDHQERINEYDSLGRVSKIKEWYGFKSHEQTIKAFEYDLLNRVIEERIEDVEGNILTKTAYTYDALGNRNLIIQEKEEGLATTSITYSTEGPVKIVDSQGHITHIHYGIYKNSFDQNVPQITTCDPKGKLTIVTKDALGRTIQTQQKNSVGTLLSYEEFFYDAANNLSRKIDVIIAHGKPLKDIHYVWLYNACNKPIVFFQALGTPEQKTTHYSYNGHGQKDKIIKPDGIEIIHQYDLLGRLWNFYASDASFNYTFRYNLNHEMTHVYDNKYGTVTERELDASGNLLKETLANGLTLHYSYDRQGRLLSTVLPDQTGISYDYAAVFCKKANRLSKEKEILYSHHYRTFDKCGTLITEDLINHQPVKHQYDIASRPKLIQTNKWRQTIENYDQVNNLLKFEIEDAIGTTSPTFNYNDLNQLISETGDFSHNYELDSINNRLKKDQQNYDINNLNQLLKEGETVYHYDRNGNLIFKKQGNEETHFGYDALDRLIKVTKNQRTTEYRYDSFNRRLSKIQNGKEWKFLYQGQNEIGQMDPSGQIIEFRMLGCGKGAEIGATVAIELQKQVYTPLSDINGNIVTLLTNSGETYETYRFSSFGEEQLFDSNHNKISTSSNPWRYSSKRYDAETGFIYFGHRYYDPKIGRWVTEDPLGFGDGPNLYAYLHHNPLSYYDSYGLYSEEAYAYRDSQQAALRAPEFNDSRDKSGHFNETNFSYADYRNSLSIGSGFWNSVVHPLEMLSKNYEHVALICQCIRNNDFTPISEAYQNTSSLEVLDFVNQRIGEASGLAICCAEAELICIGRAAISIGRAGISLIGRVVAERTAVRAISSVSKTEGIAIARNIIPTVESAAVKYDINALSRAGQVMDREGLTKAGRALDKHGNRSKTVFPKATGNPASKNRQGQFHVDDILTHPNSTISQNYRREFGNVIEIQILGDRGLRYTLDGKLIGFLNP